MPIYEYQCTSCHHHFDLMQKISDKPVTQCPKCFENKVIKLVSAAGFQLKGTGWYATDFKNSGSGAAKPADSSGSPATPESKTTTETKPAETKSGKGDSE